MAWRLCGWDFHNLDIRKLYRQFQAWALQNDDDDDDDDDDDEDEDEDEGDDDDDG